MAESDKTKPQQSPGAELSRRDFLRRAGKEAAVTGTKLVPGAAIAQKVLGIGVTEDIKTKPTDAAPDAPKSLGERLAAWRRRRQSGSEDDKT